MYFGKNELNSFFQKSWPGALVVFSLSLLLSRWFWPTLTFTDPDSFYHLKMTELLAGGLVRDFSWLPFTSLTEHFADHHFLYHLLLFPFVKFFGPLAGIKIATILLVASALVTFYLVMRALRLRAPFLFTLILMTSASFMFRLHLAKAPALSLILVLLEIFAIIKVRPRLLGVLSFIHVWTHGSWPLPLIFAGAWFLGQRVFARRLLFAPSPDPSHEGRGTFFPLPRWEREGVRVTCSALIGTLAGLILNPYFPQNLAFYWTQIVQIAVLNIQTVVSVGAEWYPAGAAEFLAGGGLVLPVFALALIIFVFHAADHAPIGWSMGVEQWQALRHSFGFVLLAVIASLMTIKSRRHLDYSMPMILLAASSLFTLTKASTHQFIAWVRQYRFIALTLAVLLFSLLMIVGDRLLRHRAALSGDHTPHELSGPLDFLMRSAPLGSIVFHTEWDDFPLLLYGAPHLRYIIGLDPLFFERRDHERYKIWNRLSRAEWPTDPALAIKERFDARYIFLRKTDEALLGRLRFSKAVKPIYERDDVSIYVFLE